MALLLDHAELQASECNAYSLTDRSDLLEKQAEELTAQTKGMRVLDWTVRSLCDPKNLLN